MIATSSVAADLPSRKTAATPAASVAYNWGGFYIGANLGGAWGRVKEGLGSWRDINGNYASRLSDGNASGLIGGLGVGFNIQSSSLVYGLEFDTSISRLVAKGQANYDFISNSVTSPLLSRTAINNVSSGRLRLGYAVDDYLVFGTAGIAAGQIRRKITQGYSGVEWLWLDKGESNSSTDVKVGWTLGGGVEKALTNNLTARLQYLYTDLGSVSYAYRGYPDDLLNEGTQKIKVNQSAVTIGLNYNFGAPSNAR